MSTHVSYSQFQAKMLFILTMVINQTIANRQMIMDTGPTTDNLESSSCSVQTNVSPNHFRTINSIYELHSIINQLSIEKQKSNIALSSATKNHHIELAKMIDEIANLRELNSQIAGGIQFYKKQIDGWKSKYDSVIKERNELQRVLDKAPMIQNKMSISLLISEYEKLKRKEQQWNAQLLDANSQIKSLQISMFQAKAENSSLRNNFQHQASLMGIKLQQQRNVYAMGFAQLKNQHELEKQKMSQTIVRLHKQRQQIQRQNEQLNTKVEQIRRAMNEQHKLYIQNQLLQLSNPADHTVSSQKYNQLRIKYHQQLDNKNQIMAQFSIKSNQVSNLKSIIQNYVKEIQGLEERLNQKQLLHHQMKEFFQLNTIEIIRTQPSDYLAKLQEISFANSKEKKQLLSQVEIFKRKNKILQQKIGELTQSKEKSEQRIIFQNTTIQRIQSSNQTLAEKLDKSQKTTRKLKNENDQLTYQCEQLKLQLRRNQSKPNESNDPTKISAQKYHNLMEGIAILGADKNRLIKENIQIKSQLQNAENEIIRAIKGKNQIQYQLRNKIRAIQTLQAKNQDLIQGTVILKNNIDKKSNQHIQEIKELLSKMNILNECVNKLKSERISRQKLTLKIQQKFENKTRNNQICQNILNLKINPSLHQNGQITSSHLNHVKKMIRAEKKKQNSFTTNIQSGKQQQNSNNFQLNLGKLQQIKYRQRSQSDRIRIDRIRDFRMPKVETEDEQLNKMISQLKKQNRQLSKGHFT